MRSLCFRVEVTFSKECWQKVGISAEGSKSAHGAWPRFRAAPVVLGLIFSSGRSKGKKHVGVVVSVYRPRLNPVRKWLVGLAF